MRKQQQPSFFVPEGEITQKEELPPAQFRAALPPAPEVSTNKYDKGVRMDKKNVYSDEPLDVEEYKYYSSNEKVSPYKKAFDEYVRDLQYMKNYNEIPINQQKEKDLGKMNSEGIFRVW
ncbi:MAG: hypothetical protein LBR70_03450 [Lactobacillaceae bacterium]|nr:hypothetical protein [Lactobacillaceae bacterium]